jgi:hypothetical protein
VSKASDLIEEYLSVGGLFNPEIMNQMQHDAVRDTLIIARDEIRGLEKRIKRLEEAGDAAIHEAGHGREHDALEIWRKAKEDKL